MTCRLAAQRGGTLRRSFSCSGVVTPPAQQSGFGDVRHTHIYIVVFLSFSETKEIRRWRVEASERERERERETAAQGFSSGRLPPYATSGLP